MPSAQRQAGLQQTLLRAWTRRGLLACLLWPVSLLYRLVVTSRQMLYRSGLLQAARLPVPLIVVGNVVAGGAGKTPVVMALVAHLQARGWRVGVISRGYGRSQPGCLEVRPDSPAQQVGDEPALIARRTGVPVFVAERRLDAGLALLKAHPQTQLLISDDGLQHLQLARDLEIGVFDDRGVGNGWLLPAGPLRESWPRALDLTLHTGQSPAFGGFHARRHLESVGRRADGSTLALSALHGRPVMALAAIAQPEAFFAMLRTSGVQLDRVLALPDHYDFTSYSRSTHEGYTLICTEKDAVKLWPLEPQALAVGLAVTLPEAFWQALDTRLGSITHTHPNTPP